MNIFQNPYGFQVYHQEFMCSKKMVPCEFRILYEIHIFSLDFMVKGTFMTNGKFLPNRKFLTVVKILAK